MTDNIIEQITTVLDTEHTLEDLVRQLLSLLALVTRMESTYLTRIEPDESRLHIQFSYNSNTLSIPEGLSVPWEDTLCKRALDDGRRYTSDVVAVWGNSVAAKALGITTYVSIPVTLGDGALYGTLCAASSERQAFTGHGEHVLHLFSRLIAQQIQTEKLMKELRQTNAALTRASYVDALTGLPNRRAVFEQLPRLFFRARDESRYVLIAFVDLDGFKQINDVYGHEAGDDFLCAMGSKLREGERKDEVSGRVGGDEFIVAGMGAAEYNTAQGDTQALRSRLSTLLSGEFRLASCVIDYAGPSIGVVAVNPSTTTPDEAVQQADQMMYVDKHMRKNEAARTAKK